MAGKKIRIGMIGVGQIGKYHIENYQKIPDAEIVVLADINEKEGRHVSEIYGIPNVYTDFRQLLERDDIEAVDVCLHNNLHAPITVAALKAGKHVYCEKPMAGAYHDAAVMMETARSTKKRLSIQLSTLFTKETRAAKILIDGGQLGKIYYARATGFRRRGRPFVDGYGAPAFVQKRIAGGGALYDMGVYHIANILYLLGNPEVHRISGKTFQMIEMDAARKELGNYDVEELGLGFVRCKGEIVLDIIEAWAIILNPFEGSSIVGSEGGIRLQPFSFHKNFGDLEMDTTINLDSADYRWHTLSEDGDAFDSPQQHWVAALCGRVELLPTAEIALNTMLVSEGIYLSDKLGREVATDEVIKSSKSTAIKL